MLDAIQKNYGSNSKFQERVQKLVADLTLIMKSQSVEELFQLRVKYTQKDQIRTTERFYRTRIPMEPAGSLKSALSCPILFE